MKRYFFNKKLLFSLFFINLIGFADVLVAQVSNSFSNVEIPKQLERKFRRDAARIALRLDAEKEDLRYLGVIIPMSNIEMIYGILTQIYKQDETAKSIAKCNVHTFPNPSIDQLVIIYEKDIDWATPLREGISETESLEINDLLHEFDLVIEKHLPWNDTQSALTIRSKEPLNMAALAGQFMDIEGVVDIDLGIPKIGGNDIIFSRISNGWEIEYMLKFGAYLSGGGKKHSWKYRMLDDGSLQFIEESGSPIPSWMRCESEGNPLVFKG